MNKIAIDKTNDKTPPNLLGIDRRIAYTNRKYHSGWIWTGVTKGLAGIKLSGSPSIYGLINEIKIRNITININPTISLNLK